VQYAGRVAPVAPCEMNEMGIFLGITRISGVTFASYRVEALDDEHNHFNVSPFPAAPVVQHPGGTTQFVMGVPG
jgi:hypothetical protein